MGDVSVMAILKSIDMRQYLPAQLPRKLKAIKGRMVFSAAPLLLQALKAHLRPGAYLRRYQDALPRHVERFRVPEEDGRSLQEQATEPMGLLHFFFLEFGLPMMVAAQVAQQRIKRLFGSEAALVRDHLMSRAVDDAERPGAPRGHVEVVVLEDRAARALHLEGDLAGEDIRGDPDRRAREADPEGRIVGRFMPRGELVSTAGRAERASGRLLSREGPAGVQGHPCGRRCRAGDALPGSHRGARRGEVPDPWIA